MQKISIQIKYSLKILSTMQKIFALFHIKKVDTGIWITTTTKISIYSVNE